ncbi:MAG: cytochrome C biogenesis protein, partial [Cenarchaeum sp. SB0664_bin_35]|nr:cytochrome C biogenesis protein [Cenarchaeum sp. SB0664_bin_35]
VAALAGLGSFWAPCILPMIPAFLAYISGTTLADLNKSSGEVVVVNRASIVLNSVFFVLGFSVVFSMIGVVINSTLIGVDGEFVGLLNQVGGIIIIGFGAFLILSTKINSLNMEKKFLVRREKASYPLSFVFGLAFAVGWTPCVGPILGTILTLAATTPAISFNLLLVYSLSLGIPFIVMAIFFSRSQRIIRAMSRHLKYYSVVLGAFIIILGVLVYTNQLAYLANFPLLNELIALG